MQFQKYWKSWATLFVTLIIAGLAIWHFNYGHHEKNIRNIFFDPGSVQIEDRHWTLNGEYFCAKVNAKNRYGAYTGFQRVITAFDYGVMEREGREELQQNADDLEHRHSAVAIRLATARLRAEKILSESYTTNPPSTDFEESAKKEGAKNLMDARWKEHCA